MQSFLTFIFLVTFPSNVGALTTSSWLFYLPGDHYPPLRVYHPQDIIHLSVRFLKSWGPYSTSAWLFYHSWDHFQSFRTVISSLGHLPASLCLFYDPGDHYPPVCDFCMIMGTTTHLFETVSSSWEPLSTSLWAFLSAWYQSFREFSVILESSSHLFLIVLSSMRPLPTSLWVFCHPGDDYSLLHAFMGSSSWEPLLTSFWLLYYPGYHYSPLRVCSIITKTRLCKYIKKISPPNPEHFQMKNWYFFIFLLKT